MSTLEIPLHIADPLRLGKTRRRGEGAALRERYDRGWATLIERCFAEYANAAT